MTVWLDPPGVTQNLAEKCDADAEDLGARIYEKRLLLRVLCGHGRKDCPTAKRLRLQIADLSEQQKQWDEGAARLRSLPAIGILGRSARTAKSAPPRPW